MQTYNPWWKNTADIYLLSKPHKRNVYHEVIKTIEHKSIRRFAILSGARRVGKTTVLFQIIEKLLNNGIPQKNILYISFDNPIVKMVNVDEIVSTYESLYPTGGDKYYFFDEVQYADSWELWLKVLYDSRPDIKLVATGSASPVLVKGASDSGAGRWNVMKVPTLSFYEYCKLLELADLPKLPEDLLISNLSDMGKGELVDLMTQFTPLQQHFNRYLTIGGFPELVLSDDDSYAHRMLREDVVDKVIKRDVLTLYNIRNPLSMEKLFLYLCMTSSEIFSKETAAKELKNISCETIEEYIGYLEKSNLIYVSNPSMVGSKSALKGKPKIYIADAAIRSAVLMLEDVLSNDDEMGVMVETTVYKHIVSYYQAAHSVRIGYYRKAKENQKEVDIVITLPTEIILCEVKYRNNTAIPASDAIIALSREENTKLTSAYIVTKSLLDYGFAHHETLVPVFKIPAIVFVYILGRAENNGELPKL
jgi:predicted AAA+ superfamily ATPase